MGVLELGALLTALSLPSDCAHHLGMAKPLGYGSMRITLTALHEINREARYTTFLETRDGGSRMATGIQDGTHRIPALQSAFATWYRPGISEIWQDERLRDLKALLTWELRLDNWLDRTRYLEFGQLASGDNYNEYVSLGSRLEKRRPLPPARQVLEDAKLPLDARPKFRD